MSLIHKVQCNVLRKMLMSHSYIIYVYVYIVYNYICLNIFLYFIHSHVKRVFKILDEYKKGIMNPPITLILKRLLNCIMPRFLFLFCTFLKSMVLKSVKCLNILYGQDPCFKPFLECTFGVVYLFSILMCLLILIFLYH